MSHKDNQDLRVRGQGGWAYAEHELWSVFAPLIGPAGVSVYMALCRLVPLAAINSDRQVTVRTVSEASCVGRSKCAELMKTIFDLGMVIQTKYLDGRDPTYKLASLYDLAKVGQKELLRRAGVHHADTGPFDQAAKHRRERAVRLRELQTERGEEQQAKPLPLLDESQPAESDGVRTVDAEPDESTEGAGVRNTDTVSTKTPFVSAKSGLVSAKSAFVSTPVDTLKEEKRSADLKALNPLPPDKQGDVELPDGMGEPVLPNTRPTIADAGFKTSLPFAVRWVMAELGITKKRLVEVIAPQLEVYCRQHRDTPLEEAASLMVRQGKELHSNAQLLRHHPWGWQRFFAEGHWQRPLPYASPAIERASAASVGMRTEAPQSPEDAFAHAEKVTAWIDANAHILSERGLEPFAIKLRDAARGDLALDALDQALCAIEDELCEHLVCSADREDLAKIRDQVDQEIEPYKRRMTEAQVAHTRRSVLPKRVLTAAGLPRLGLFYAPNP